MIVHDLEGFPGLVYFLVVLVHLRVTVRNLFGKRSVAPTFHEG